MIGVIGQSDTPASGSHLARTSYPITLSPLRTETLVSDPRPLEGREQHRKRQLLRPEPSQRFLERSGSAVYYRAR